MIDDRAIASVQSERDILQCMEVLFHAQCRLFCLTFQSHSIEESAVLFPKSAHKHMVLE